MTRQVAGPPAAVEDIASADVALSAAVLRYLHDLHNGRIEPRAIGFRLRAPVDRHDFAAILLAALGDNQITEAAARLRPPLAQYRLLRAGLARYRALTASQAPPAARVRQVELALERLRWLPHLGEQRLLVVNIPMFRLWGWDAIPASGAPSFGMAVIVGRALDRQTPVFVEDLREVVFRPYWNVPRSILRAEMLPLIERDPAYLQREDLEIVSGPGDDARPVEFSPDALNGLREGVLRIRQRPGPRNALGLIKFVFPNAENVYMHATPAQTLFARSRRDFSHGCVRVEDAFTLAEWALQGTPGWSRDRIVSATTSAASTHVKLSRPVQVILFYTTAVAMPEDGTIHFARDIYRHDARLDRALRTVRSRRAAQVTVPPDPARRSERDKANAR